MSTYEVIERRGDIRVRLVPDTYPEPPYDEGASPILQIDWRWRADGVEQVGSSPFVLPSEILEAADRLLLRESGEREKFERYLRIYHSTTAVVWYGLNRATDHLYVSFDTAEWRKHMGITDEWAATNPVASLEEWIAYIEGDVWGVVVEQRVEKQTRTRTPGEDGHVFHESGWYEEWIEADSCFGFYGYKYAVQSAKEQLDYHAPVEANHA